MGQRTILLIAAALVAALGAGMVFLYVQGVEKRAKLRQAPVLVLKAVAQIEPGETLTEAQEAGKLELGDVPAEQRLDGAMDAIGDSGSLVALTTVFTNEQITAAKFGAPGAEDVLSLPGDAIAISVNVSDPARVAGFVTPGSKVALFMTGQTGPTGEEGTRLLLSKVTVMAVAQTTVTDPAMPAEGEQVAESLPRTLITLAVDQREAEKVLFASTHGELSFGLLGAKSIVEPGTGVTQQNLFG